MPSDHTASDTATSSSSSSTTAPLSLAPSFSTHLSSSEDRTVVPPFPPAATRRIHPPASLVAHTSNVEMKPSVKDSTSRAPPALPPRNSRRGSHEPKSIPSSLMPAGAHTPSDSASSMAQDALRPTDEAVGVPGASPTATPGHGQQSSGSSSWSPLTPGTESDRDAADSSRTTGMPISTLISQMLLLLTCRRFRFSPRCRLHRRARLPCQSSLCRRHSASKKSDSRTKAGTRTSSST